MSKPSKTINIWPCGWPLKVPPSRGYSKSGWFWQLIAWTTGVQRGQFFGPSDPLGLLYLSLKYRIHLVSLKASVDRSRFNLSSSLVLSSPEALNRHRRPLLKTSYERTTGTRCAAPPETPFSSKTQQLVIYREDYCRERCPGIPCLSGWTR